MRITESERQAVIAVVEYGWQFGYGNLIAHLQTAWARHLVNNGMSESAARRASGGAGYPFRMQRDVMERGEWDESGRRYRKAVTKRSKATRETPP